MGTYFRSDAALFPNYFGQTCLTTRKHRSGYLHRRLVVLSPSKFEMRRSNNYSVVVRGAHNGQLIYESIMAAAATLKEQRPFISAVFPATLSARHSHRLPRPVAQRTKRD